MLVASLTIIMTSLALASISVATYYFVSTEKMTAVIVPLSPMLVKRDWSKDAWTECIILGGAIAPRSSLGRYIIDPLVAGLDDPCEALLGAIRADTPTVWEDYPRYWLASVPLTTLALAGFGFQGAHIFFLAMLVISLSSVGVASFARLRCATSRRASAIVLVGAAVGGGVAGFGGHLGHGPTFFAGMFCLATALSIYSCISRRSVAIAFSALGTVTAYYDLLSGGIPFIFAIAIFLHLLLLSEARNHAPKAAEVAASVMTAGVAYGGGIIVPIVLKILVLRYGLGQTDVITKFYSQLMWRLSDDQVGASGGVAAWNLAVKLWGSRPLVFIGGAPVSTMFYLAGLAGWLAALGLALMTWLRRGQTAALMAGLAPLVGAGVVVVWFLLFTSHGYIHSWFMTRVMSLVPAMGMAAFVLAQPHWGKLSFKRGVLSATSATPAG
jgi:hypothetical protein